MVLTEKNQKIVIVVLAVMLVLALILAYYYYSQFQNFKANPQQIAEQEVKTLVTKVGQLIVLPEGENPTIATVVDPEMLKNQPFFANAKLGDKVLIYTNARKAILYSPTTHKIVEVAPLNIGAPATP